MDDLGAAVNAEMLGLMEDATETVNVLVEVPKTVLPEYVVRVAVAVTLVEFGRYAYHVVGIVNEVEEVLAATSTVTAGAFEYVKTSL